MPRTLRLIILFDGLCNFCEASVNFIIDRDPRGRFKFAPLQSPTGQALLDEFKIDKSAIDSLVLIDGPRAYRKSTAALHIARRLTGLWPVFSVCFAIPEPIRNWAYDFVARNRYKWFGKKDACRMPTAEIRGRFLDEPARH